jgi:hypothetical protein
MDNQILDNEAFEVTNESIQKHRVGAIFLEGLSISFVAFSILIGNQRFLVTSIFLLAFIYLLGGWYIFKGDKYRMKDIIFVTISVFFALFPIPLVLIFKMMHWQGGEEMLSDLFYSIPIFGIVWIIWYFVHRHRPLEWRLSWKLLSRVVVLALLLFAFM